MNKNIPIKIIEFKVAILELNDIYSNYIKLTKTNSLPIILDNERYKIHNHLKYLTSRIIELEKLISLED